MDPTPPIKRALLSTDMQPPPKKAALEAAAAPSVQRTGAVREASASASAALTTFTSARSLLARANPPQASSQSSMSTAMLLKQNQSLVRKAQTMQRGLADTQRQVCIRSGHAWHQRPLPNKRPPVFIPRVHATTLVAASHGAVDARWPRQLIERL